MFSGGFFLLKEILNPKIKKKARLASRANAHYSHSQWWLCLHSNFCWVPSSHRESTNTKPQISNEPRSHSRKTRRKQEFEKTAGDRRKKIKKTNKETDSVRRHSVWRSLPRQPQPSFVVHLLFGWSSLTESLEQATDMFQFISARSLNYLYHSFSSVPLSRPRRVHRWPE